MLRIAVLAALLTAGGCSHQPPNSFDPSHLSDLSCRQSSSSLAPAVTWLSSGDRDAQWRLSRWCQTVGPVFFDPEPASPTAGAIDRVALVSWNIHEGNGDVDALVARLRAGAFTGGQPVEHVVLLLQEVTRRDPSVPSIVAPRSPSPRSITSHRGSAATGVRHFADQGFAVLYAPSMRNGRGSPGADAEDRGNAILSTLPLRDARLIELPLEHQRRVAVAASVSGRTGAGAAWSLDLIDVHLDTALALLHRGPFAARRRQASALLEALAGTAGADRDRHATVLGGDLNTWMGSRESAVHLLDEAFPGTPPADRAATWRGPLGVHAALDHVFVRGAVSASPIVRLPDRFGSDHFPLLTVLHF